MIKNLALSLLLAAGLLTGSALNAAEEPATKPASVEPEKKVRNIPFRGKIASIDKEKKTITLEGRVRKRVLHTTDKTKFVKDGKPATFLHARVGDEVGGTLFRTEDGKEQVVSIRLGPKPGSKSDQQPGSTSAKEAEEAEDSGE